MNKLLLILAVSLLASAPAFAGPSGTVTMKYLGVDNAPFDAVSLYASSDNIYPPYEISHDADVLAGYYEHDISAATGHGAYVDDPLWAFCIDLLQNPATDYTTFNVVALTAAPDPTFIGSTITGAKANLLRELWGRHYSKTMTAQQAAQFQLAVWEIVFETSGTYDISGGSLFSNDHNAGTNTLLNSLDGTGPMASLVALTHCDYQDMLATIPAPGALLLGGIGAGLVGFVRNRRML